MVVTNKPSDIKSIRRAQIGITCLEIDNSMLFEDSSIVLSKRGFLEAYNLFKYATFMEECTKDSYIYCISSIMSVTLLSLIFAVFRGDTLFEPVHFLIFLCIEIGISEFLYSTIVDSEEVANEQIDSDDLMKGYSLDEKSRKTMRYQTIYSVLVPSILFIFNLLPSEGTYFYNSEALQARVLSGVPEQNTFIFIFLLVSRLCCLLNFRCKNVATWASVIQKREFIVIAS
jgi:hypothetical protein